MMANDDSFGRNGLDRDRYRRDARGGDRDRDRDRSGRDRDRDRSPLRNSNARQQRNDCRIFISNLPYEFRWQELKDLLRREVGEVAFVELFHDENDKPKGSGIVEFEHPDCVKKAIDKLHRYDVDGRKIIVKEDYGAPRDKYGVIIRRSDRDRNLPDNDRHRSSGAGGGGGNDWKEHRGGSDGPGKNYQWGETYGLSPTFLEGLNIAPPLVNRVFVANLDYKVTEKKLREVFKLAGKVRDVELSVDSEGKSRGFAVIEYDHPVESVQAISMLHNQQLYDRRLTVRMDRVDNNDPTVRLPEGLANVGMGLGQNGAPLKDVARNLPSVSSASIPAPNPLTNLTAAAALSAANPLSAISGLGPSAAALQAAAALNPTGAAGLLGAAPGGNLDLLAARDQLTARELALSNFANTLGSGLVGSSPSGGVAPASLRDTLGSRGSSGRDSNVPPKSSDTILVDNLPSNFTWQTLKEKFREAGDIKFSEMRGKLGLVRFSSEWEAIRAVSMFDRSRVDGQVIDVRLF